MIAVTAAAVLLLACIAGLSVVTAGVAAGRHRITRRRK